MKAIVPLFLLSLVLSACAAPPAPPIVRPPVVQPRPSPPPPLPKPPIDWRDAAQTPGTWTWAMVGGRSTASFGMPGMAQLMTLTCDRAQGRILLARAGTAAVAVPLAVATTSGRRPLLSDPALSRAGTQTGWLVASLPASDPLLDAIAFSRGRFALETAGLQTLYLPAWPEISRVIEDCR